MVKVMSGAEFIQSHEMNNLGKMLYQSFRLKPAGSMEAQMDDRWVRTMLFIWDEEEMSAPDIGLVEVTVNDWLDEWDEYQVQFWGYTWGEEAMTITMFPTSCA